jgi:hypothetical protein
MDCVPPPPPPPFPCLLPFVLALFSLSSCLPYCLPLSPPLLPSPSFRPILPSSFRSSAQFYGKASSYGSQVDLWTGNDEVTLTIDLIDSSSFPFGEQVWSITEFPGSVKTGLFTVSN